jgi:hypothetical protein
MDRISIDKAKRCFLRGGKPFFYLADTLWMAFSKLQVNEWEEILLLRRMQRFTVVQISALPISHDNSEDEGALVPFAPDGKGGWNFDVLNDAYFDKACTMLGMAAAMGLTPCIHLMWANYIPDTWAAKRSPVTVMPMDSAMRYVEYAVKRFLPYGVIYSLSGDTAFETPRVCEYYRRAAAIVRNADPEALVTLHLQPHADVPEDLCPLLDFYSFQGGHVRSGRDASNQYRFAQHYWKKPGLKPVVNTEPPYDGHGYGFEYGRHNAFDIRRAVWQSLLSGAQAGVAYGAHGLWSMHRFGQRFNNPHFSGQPADWRTALRFDGAWEPAFARMITERYDLFGLEPMDDLPGQNETIRMARTKDCYVLYVPYVCDVQLPFGLPGYDIELLELEHKHPLQAEVETGEDTTTLLMPQVNSDLLYIIRRSKS